MATYTIELRKICDIYTRDTVESWFKNYNLSNYLTEDQINSITKQGIWSKDKLATKIVDYYYMREIGYETPALFELKVKGMMEGIMEYYLPIIYLNTLTYDPLINENYVEEFSRNIDGSAENEGTSNSNSNSNSSNLSILNNTPQTNINKQDIERGVYATSVTQSDNNANINDKTTTNNTGTSNTKEQYTRSTKGNRGVLVTAQKLIEQSRSLIMDVDNQIIQKLNPLFMGIF